MRILVSILVTSFLVSCGIENLLTPKTDMNKLTADVEHDDGNEYVGETIKIDAKVEYIMERKDGCYTLVLETNGYGVRFYVKTCDDKYVEGETYTLMIYIKDVYFRDSVLGPGSYVIEGELK